MLKRLFEKSGIIECFIKKIAYSKFLPKKKLKELYHKLFLKKGEKVEVNDNIMESIYKYIDSLGIQEGDILIVHSSLDGMRKANPNPEEIINYLLRILGTDGTLVLPTFPIINLKYNNNKIPLYNPKRTLCWTGMLPNIFLGYEGVIRSEFPYNSLAALGAQAEEMMKNNLLDDVPHGNNSAWKYCVDHHAKILYLGINIAECNTVLHMADDILDEEWPIKNWYETQRYKIKKEKNVIEKDIRVCSSFWVKYNTCYYFNAQLKKKGFISEEEIEGVNIGFSSDSHLMMNYVISQAKSGKIRYRIPKKYWKVR